MDEPLTGTPAPSSIPGGARRPTLTLDLALYESYLADRGLDEAQKRALLEALWSIIVGFVDLGFAVEPAVPCAGDADRADEELASPQNGMINSEAGSTKSKFEKAVDRDLHFPAGMRE